MPRPDPATHPGAGFTLLEVLVALVVLALSLGALFAALSSGLGLLQRSGERVQAALALESTLARLGADIPLVPGRQSGDAGGGLRWEVAIAQADAAGFGVAVPEGHGLLVVTVAAAPPGGVPVSAQTLRLVRLP